MEELQEELEALRAQNRTQQLLNDLLVGKVSANSEETFSWLCWLLMNVFNDQPDAVNYFTWSWTTKHKETGEIDTWDCTIQKNHELHPSQQLVKLEKELEVAKATIAQLRRSLD